VLEPSACRDVERFQQCAELAVEFDADLGDRRAGEAGEL
jgi:hypothetical protein